MRDKFYLDSEGYPVALPAPAKPPVIRLNNRALKQILNSFDTMSPIDACQKVLENEFPEHFTGAVYDLDYVKERAKYHIANIATSLVEGYLIQRAWIKGMDDDLNRGGRELFVLIFEIDRLTMNSQYAPLTDNPEDPMAHWTGRKP